MKRKLSIIFFIVLVSSTFYSCKKADPVADVDTPVAEEPTENSAPVMVEETSEEVEEETADNSWAEAYLSIITEWHVLQEDDSAEGYSLVYLNDDDIPELCIFGDNGYGTDIYTFFDGKASHVEQIDFNGNKNQDNTTNYTDGTESAAARDYVERKGVYFTYAGGEYGYTWGYYLDGDKLKEIYYVCKTMEEQFEDGEEVGCMYSYVINYMKKDGALFENKEERYEDWENPENKPDVDYAFYDLDEKYMSELETEYDFTNEEIKCIDDIYYSYEEICKELRKYCPIDTEDMTDFSWLNSYIDYLKSVDEEEYATAAVVYVDDDNIPEIVLAGNYHTFGSLVLTIGEDKTVKDHQFGNDYVYYMPRRNVMYNNNSGAGGVQDDISCIENAGWKTLFWGMYSNDVIDPVTDDFTYGNYCIYDKGDYEEGEGRSVSEKEYYDTMDAVFKERGYEEDAAKEVAFSYTIDDLIKELKQILAEKTGEEYEESEPWKAVFRDKLYDIYNGTEILNDCSLADSPGDNGNVVFCLIDVVDDETPELLASRKWPEGNLENPDWNIYQYDGDKCINIGRMTFYDTDNKKFYSYECGSSDEEFFSYTLTGGKETRDVGIMLDDYDGYDRYTLKTYNGNDCLDQEVSENEWSSFMKAYKNGIEKYGIKGIELTKENIKKELGE